MSLYKYNNIIFFDIETAAAVDDFEKLTPVQQKHFLKKYKPEDWDKSWLHAEFSRVACIAYATNDAPVRVLMEVDEAELLRRFAEQLSCHAREDKLCGHYIKGFDVPFLRKRYLINNLPVPFHLKRGSGKPWESPHIDTLEMWAGVGKWEFAGLELLCDMLGIDNPKTDLTGEMVSPLFRQWLKEQNSTANYDRIAAYCKADVEATRELYQRLINS